MIRFVFIIFATLLLSSANTAAAKPQIILDTDIGIDADDLGALAMLHRLLDKDECELLAVICATTELYAVPAVSAVNHFYGRPNIPIGSRKIGVYHKAWNYNRVLAQNFPHSTELRDGHNAVDLYRKLLEKSEDHSIVIVTIGPLQNIQALLLSEADEFSPLSGAELIEKKVKEFVITGGYFPEGENEWNFDGDAPGVTKFVLENLQSPITFIGLEIGRPIMSGANISDPESPLFVGYQYFFNNAPWIHKPRMPWIKMYYKRHVKDNFSFDQTAILYAVRNGVETFWGRVENGYCVADETGGNKWVTGSKFNHSYLTLTADPEKMGTLIESLMLHAD